MLATPTCKNRCYQIRMRAQRKVGELTKQIEKATGNQYASPRGPEKQKALAAAGVSTQQASEWERLSEVPAMAECPFLPPFEIREWSTGGRRFTSGLLSTRLARAAYSDPSRRKIQRQIPIAIRHSREPVRKRLQSWPALRQLRHQAKITPLHSYFPYFAFPQTDSGRQRHNGA
jgi:hypothetical protein